MITAGCAFLTEANFPKPLTNFEFYTTQKVDEAVLRRINQQALCKIYPRHCQSIRIAENLESFYAVGGVYALDFPGSRMLYKHHKTFEGYIKSFGVEMVTIEGVFQHQSKFFPEFHQVNINVTSYRRENLLNVAISKLKSDWEYVTWIDTHQSFENPYWWEEAIYKMEKHQTTI